MNEKLNDATTYQKIEEIPTIKYRKRTQRKERNRRQILLQTIPKPHSNPPECSANPRFTKKEIL